MRAPAWHHLLFCAGLVGTLGCVVPVGPEWTDPQNDYPPTIGSATPPVGSVLTNDPDASQPLTVEVVLSDQNTRDALYLRWIIDYPPYVDGVSRLAQEWTLPGGDNMDRPSVYFAPNCKDDQIASGFSNHRLLLAVADRKFAPLDPSSTSLDAVPPGNFLVEGAWQFTLDCP
jgi:hypothetical protein